MSKQKSEQMVVVGMSGGVDSSVCAALLSEDYSQTVGMFMKNWEENDEFGVCMASKEFADVTKVAEGLAIPYYSVEFIKEYREEVFEHFLREYEKGFTPNPDILCNREIKFKVFFEKARELGAEFLATGHYCQKLELNGRYYLEKGADKGKDQTYFLYTMKESVLKNVLFPIGHLQKSEVREVARKYNLATQDKKDSTGICFIGERNFKNFLSQFLTLKKGDFKNLSGEVVGTHDGSAYYTIGQRKGLGLGGQGEPWFVVDKNHDKNEVIVERGEFHPALYADELWANELSFVGLDQYEIFEKALKSGPVKLRAKIRYRQADQECEIVSIDKETATVHVRFAKPQRAITIRQSIVFYTDTLDNEGKIHEICLGGGMIQKRGETYFERGLVLPSEIDQ